MPVLHTLTAQESWRGLEGYEPVIKGVGVPGGGSVVAVNYTGRGIVMAISHDAEPCAIQIKIDGVEKFNSTAPAVMTLLIGFETSLYVKMSSGGAGGPGTVSYLKET